MRRAYLWTMAVLVLAASQAPAQRAFKTDPNAPKGKIGVPLAVGQARVTVRNLRLLNHPDVQPPKGAFFIAFDLTIENRSRASAFRMSAFFEGLLTPEGKPLVAGSALNTLADEAGMALPNRPEGGEQSEVKAGQTLTIPIARTVPVGTKRAIFVSMLGFQAGTNNRRDYKIDLGTLPAYTPPTDIVVPLGQPVERGGISVRILSAVRDNTKSEQERMLEVLAGGKEASEGEKALLGALGAGPSGNPKAPKPVAGPKVKLKVMVSAENRSERPWEAGMNNIVLEDSDGRTYGPDILSGPMIPPLRPGQGADAAYIFRVPQSKLRGLKARINPTRGHGPHVIPLGL